MNALDVRIVKLESMRVASFYAFGSKPEEEAMKQLVTWAKPKSYLEDPETHPVFGFNNPSPSPGSPNYGYEFWIVVGSKVEGDGEAEIKDFPGGLYAVAHCEVGGRSYESIPACWQKLVAWREDSAYRSATHQWLEQQIRDDFSPGAPWDLELYLPIAR